LLNIFITANHVFDATIFLYHENCLGGIFVLGRYPLWGGEVTVWFQCKDIVMVEGISQEVVGGFPHILVC